MVAQRKPIAPAQSLREELADIEALSHGEADDLQALMADLAGSSSSKITVYRVVKNQPLAYVFACTPDAFSLDELRDRYNGGEFRLFIAKDGALWKNKRIFVEPKSAQQTSEPPPTAAAELAAAMRDGFARQAEMMQAIVRASAQPNGSLFSGMDLPATITAIAAAVTALRPPPVPPAPPPLQADPNQAIDMLLKGIELARDLKADAGGGDEPSLMTILRDLIRSPVLAQAVAASSAPAPARLQVRPPAPGISHYQLEPNQVVAPALHQSFASETSAQPAASTNMLTQYLTLLVRKAAEGGDPALYADLVLDNVDADMLQVLLARPPSPVDALIGDHAPIAAHREWFQALVDTISEALAEPAPSQAQLPGLVEGHANDARDSAPLVLGEHSAG